MAANQKSVLAGRDYIHGLPTVAHAAWKRSIRIVGDRWKRGVWTLAVHVQRSVTSHTMRRKIFRRFLCT